MPSKIDVTALYAHDWNSVSEYDGFETNLVKNAPPAPGHGLVLGYDDADDLVQKVDGLLIMDPDHPCLRSLEIWAHANPVTINDLSRPGSSFGQKLKALKWCDEASIYLTGCNTGLSRSRGPANTRGPIAKMLADSMAFNATSFAHKITVYGSAGYLSGSNATGKLATSTGYSTGWLWWKVVWETYSGSRDASGTRVWNTFKNW